MVLIIFSYLFSFSLFPSLVLRDDNNYAQYASRQRLPPQFEVEFTQSGDAVIPLTRGLIVTGDVVYVTFIPLRNSKRTMAPSGVPSPRF